ncbi:MAG: transcription-repair coupling factor [Deltaproteobacteria bacterium]|jgi:transcription-repair coupling factor (superfamily II helicase)|nr:transcription-repair coupling factor [Deltaproteobacteria bacterium]
MERYSGRLTDLDPRGGRLELGGLPLSALARQIGLLMQGPFSRRKLAVVTPSAVEAEDFLGDLRFFWPGGECALMPGFDRKPFMQKYSGVALAGERMSAARRLAGDGPLVLVTSVPAALRMLPPADEIEGRSLKVTAGEEADFEAFVRFLAEGGYQRVDQVEGPGDCSVRGGIVDVFPAGMESPLRLEFFGDFVDSIRSFRVEDQRSSGRLESADLPPLSQAPVNDGTLKRAYAALTRLADRHGWLDLLWEPVARGFLEGRLFADFENWSPLFADNLAGFSRFLAGAGALPVLYEPARIVQAGEATWLGLGNHFSRLASDGRPHLPAESLYEGLEAFLDGITRLPAGIIAARETPLPGEPGLPGSSADGGRFIVFGTESTGILRNLPGRAGKNAGFLDPLAGKIRSLLGRGFKTTLVLKNPEQKRRLVELLYDRDLSPVVPPKPAGASRAQPLTGDWRPGAGQRVPGADAGVPGRLPQPGKRGLSGLPGPAVWTGPSKATRPGGGELAFAVGQLSGGFVAPYDFEAFIAEEEIFGVRRVRRTKAFEEIRGQGSLSDLSPGDYVVHANHGVGQYRGLSSQTMSTGYRGDFLAIAYRDDSMLYVPVESFGVVSKYVGPDDKPPPLDRLGSGNWERVKARVKADVKAVAEDLLKLYAARKASQGNACAPRDGDFLNFEAAFPFEETPDQARAIEDVMRDLERPAPMDRLVCGDVGFGKTEVAIRAAYRVVSENRQAAVLVPTTILAEQHERSFRERFRDWPVTVESLTRFKTPREQKAVLAALKLGSVDVVIGTHRILQKDVEFKDLGLLVVDEEHRFGVKDKERLKRLRANVDVLSMSATPIPRSLSMSMSGIRDMSIIQTPPVDRLSVITSLIRADDALICEAIDRELARGGQVFFIHNRVKDIHLWVERLQSLMPLVRFGVGHGQMRPAELEAMMEAFWNKEIDVWISTTIVESGLDFPSANTIIIDRADNYGLAQLYQLRGRVGRSWEQAYAYLMVDDPDTLTGDARRRLSAIMENAELGSGYQVALHDMQIRGSGSVLGAAQHGQASLVGFEMYARLVEEAVAELKDEPLMDDYEPEIVLGTAAYLPDSYAPDTRARIMLYRRLSRAASDEEIAGIEAELADRFGPLPPEAKNLLELSSMKILVKSVRAKRLENTEAGLRMTFFSDKVNVRESVLDKVVELAGDPVRRITLTPDGELFVPRFNLKIRTHGPVGSVRHFLEYLDED